MDGLRALLFLLILVTVSRIHQHFRFLAPLRPALLLALLTLLYAMTHPKQLNTGKLLRFWPPRVIVALAVMACLSTAFGISIGGSAMYILTEYSKVLILAFLLIAAIRSGRDLYRFVWAYVISAAILCWMALFVFGISKPRGGAAARLSHLYTYDANDLGLILMIALPLTLLAFQVARTKGKIFCAIVLGAIGATVARTGSRGAFVGAVAVGLALLFLATNVSVVKRVAFLLVVGITLVATAPVGYWDQMMTITKPKEDYNWTSKYGRREVTKRGFGYMMGHPFFGIGIDNFPRAEGSQMSSVVRDFQDRTGWHIKWSAAHNSFLQVGAELGFPGLILWSSLVFGSLFSMLRMRRRLPTTWARGDPEQRFLYHATTYFPVAIIGFISTSVFLSFAYLDPIYMLAAFVTGMYVSVERRMREDAAAFVVPGVGGRRGVAGPRPRPQLVPAWRRQLNARSGTRG
ncbi:MAG: O-antigen ligase family protein [Gemmatimonadota bacterium]